MIASRITFLPLVILGLLASFASAGQDEAAHEDLLFFEQRIRPLLAAHCYECHSDQTDRPKANLRLDSHQSMQRGGDSGVVIVPRRPDESLLIQSVRYESLEMPPGNRLSDQQIDLLIEWVNRGAPYPPSTVASPQPAKQQEGHYSVTSEHRQYWAYQPVIRPEIPPLANRGTMSNEVDVFIADRLQSEQVLPNQRASKRQLIRRAYFDLLGLPPSPQEVDNFAANKSPMAWQELVDDLLQRPQYGERWARHWLDTVRYAESNGYERDDEKPFSWRYRDYVVDACNVDKPFDEFVVEQLAGDELREPTDASIIATGFYRLGVWDDEPDDLQTAEFDGLDDIVSTIGQVFLGQTIGCARCHNHMFDPIPQEDYYRLLALVRNVKFYVRSADQAADQTIFTQLPSGAGKALSVREHGRNMPETHMLVRGNVRTPADLVEPGVPRVLCSTDRQSSLLPTSLAPTAETTGFRMALAKWIASPDNPLTARVIANRIWQYHFGQGIVATPNDFGTAGTPPTHPELLDWLAAELMDNNWSMKHLHRIIMLSDTYQRSSNTENEDALNHDPANKLYWRQNLRRLEAESIRDTMLSISGELNPAMRGPSFFPRLSGEVVAGQSRPGLGWGVSPRDQQQRRSLYMFVKRGLRDPMMEAFDYVNTTSSVGTRPVTTVAPQALMLLNSEFTSEQAKSLARRVRRETGDHPAEYVRHIFSLALQRPPTESEQRTLVEYFTRTAEGQRKLAGQITFRPDVPSSLSGEFRQKLASPDFLLGPRQHWSYYTGRWGDGYEGIDVVDKTMPPFALWDRMQVANCVIRGLVKLDESVEHVTLLIHAQPAENRWTGYGVEISPRDQTIRIVELPTDSDSRRILASQTIDLKPRQWHAIRISSEDEKMRIYLGEQDSPVLEVGDLALTRSGYFGVSLWGGGVTFNELVAETADSKSDIGRQSQEMVFAPSWSTVGDTEIAHQRALEALCQIVLNLNEVVYID